MILRNLAKLDLNLLHVFAAVYNERNITKAAESLNVTQPAVSNSLAKLRDIFGDPLFIRARHGVAPTPLANSLIHPVSEALTSLDRAIQAHEFFDPATSTRILSFSMSDFAEALVLAPFIGALGRLGSKIVVRNHFTSERDLYPALASGVIDFAVESHLLSEPDLGKRLLLEDEFVCVVRSGHPAADAPLTIERYLELDHLHISNRPRNSNMVDGALGRLKRRRRIRATAEHCLGAGAILEKSDLCLTIPRNFVRQFLCDGRFVTLERPFRMPPLRTWLYWHPSAENSPVHTWVREVLGECFPQPANCAADHHSE